MPPAQIQSKRIETFKGTHYEIGKGIGRKYRKSGKKFTRRKMEAGLIDRQMRIYADHYPEFFDYVKGIAESGGYDEKRVFYELACDWADTQRTGKWAKNMPGPSMDEKGCTIFCVKGGLVGRNHDWRPYAEEAFGVFRYLHSKSIPFIAVGDRGIQKNGVCRNYFPDDAINQEGLFVGPTYAYHRNAYVKMEGLKPAIMIQLIAETCKTVDDALAKFEKIPVSFPKNFFIADRGGNMAVTEHTGGANYRIVYPAEGILLKTNHYLHPDLIREDTWRIRKPKHSTEKRYNEVKAKLDALKGTIGFGDVENVLCNKQSLACQNDKENDVKTIWSLTLDLAKGAYEMRYDLFGRIKRVMLSFE